MTIEFNLGVKDKPYPYTERLRRVGGRQRRVRSSKTTGEVMEILEAKYGVIDAFYEDKKPQIDKLCLRYLKADLDHQMRGGAAAKNPLKGAMSEIEEMFHRFLDKRQVEKLGIPGVPTQAALMGVKHVRGKKTIVGRRPSFVDTGLYRDSFHAWVD